MVKVVDDEHISALVNAVEDLETLAIRAQSDDEAEGESAVSELLGAYRDWYAACLGLLPDDLVEKFRFEYEGELKWNSLRYRIKHFLQDPRKPSPTYRENQGGRGNSIYGRWTHSAKDRFIDPIRQQRLYLEEVRARSKMTPTAVGSLDRLEDLGRRLPLAIAILKAQYRDRVGFLVENEYDVQQIFHAILISYFPEVEAEEPTPTLAGISSRLDFLLRQERIAVELKMTRTTLKKDKLRIELNNDIVNFRAHPDVDALFALIYDPSRFITNPSAFEHQLRSDLPEFPIRVIVVSLVQHKIR